VDCWNRFRREHPDVIRPFLVGPRRHRRQPRLFVVAGKRGSAIAPAPVVPGSRSRSALAITESFALRSVRIAEHERAALHQVKAQQFRRSRWTSLVTLFQFSCGMVISALSILGSSLLSRRNAGTTSGVHGRFYTIHTPLCLHGPVRCALYVIINSILELGSSSDNHCLQSIGYMEWMPSCHENDAECRLQRHGLGPVANCAAKSRGISLVNRHL
jgi:hypothetical protein